MTDEPRVCQVCGIREPSVRIGGPGDRESRRFLCAPCAGREEKLITWAGGGVSLVRLAGLVARNQAQRAGADSSKGCPVCGATLDEVVGDGLLGCSHCFVRFKQEVAESIRLTQGASQHLGKSPYG